MIKLFEVTLGKLSEKWLKGIVLVIISYTVLLTTYSMFTSREVELFPPRIGPDPQLKSEVEGLERKVDILINQDYKYREHLLEIQRDSQREYISRKVTIYGSYEAEKIMNKANQDLKNHEAYLQSKIEDLKLELKVLSDKL